MTTTTASGLQYEDVVVGDGACLLYTSDAADEHRDV